MFYHGCGGCGRGRCIKIDRKHGVKINSRLLAILDLWRWL